MRAIDRFVLGGLFLKKPELDKSELNQRLGRLYLRAEQTSEYVKELEAEGLLKTIKRNNKVYYQKIG